MRVLIATGIETKSKMVADTKITVKEGLLFDFPTPPKKMKVSLVKDTKGKTLVFIFE